MADLAVLFEHPEWQLPLFAALERRGVDFVAIDLKKAAFLSTDAPPAPVVFNQASPSAYLRGHERAIPFALATLRHLERLGCLVLNGADAFALELSKASQVAVSRQLGIDHPRSIVFNDEAAAIAAVEQSDVLSWPLLLKPDLGGSGARIEVLDGPDDLRRALSKDAAWQPDNLLLLQEYLPHDAEHGIIRLEMMGGKLLYPMRVVTHGRFNLCPSPVCNPAEGEEGGVCSLPMPEVAPVEFYPFPEVPEEAVNTAKRLMDAAGIDIGGVEYLETEDGRRVFYDVNANSNLRPSVAQTFGFDPFDRVAEWLEGKIEATRAGAVRSVEGAPVA